MTDHSAVKQRLNDLVFSLQDVINELKAEETAAEEAHDTWEQEGDENAEEPNFVDNEDEVQRIQNAIDSIEDAVSHLDD